MSAQALGATAEEIVARVERLPVSSWHVKTRIIIGVATFFDAFDALAIASVLPAIAPIWKLMPQQIGFLISAGYLGQLLGALFFGWVAEKYGRMTGMIWSIGTFAIMSVVCALAWNYDSLVVFRLVQGFGLGGEVPIAAVYISELARANVRGRFVLLYELIFPVGIVAASLIGLWVVPTLGWQYMFFIGAIPAVLVLFLRRVLPESPRWLANAGRMKEAELAISQIERETEKATGRPLPAPQPVVKVQEKRASYRDLFGPLYLRRTLVVWLIWFTAYLVNYGLSIWMPTVYRTVFKLPLDVALRYGLITTAIGLIGSAIAAFIIDYVGRKPLFATCFVGAGGALVVLSQMSSPSPEQVLAFITVSYFFVTAINLGVYLYTPELYPTRARALGVGVATAWLRLASMIGPTIVGIMIASGLNSVFLAFGGLALVTAIITALLASETKKRVLEEVSP
ncbi:MAG: MFS transporter [Bradyrhizobiaceae bacterium]|nr:MFS transporter [Bradyrhizobiaceae bacterium]